MKKNIFTAVLLLLTFVECFAHKINGYKYIIINQQGDIYKIESKLEDAFTKIGFKVIQPEKENDLSAKEKSYILYASYSFNIHFGYASDLTVVLRDNSRSEIYRSTTTGQSWTSSGDMSKAVGKLFKNMKKLNYTFDETMTPKNVSYDIPCRFWSEDSIKTYLKNKPKSSIEGIYKNLSNNGEFYRFAIINSPLKF